MKYRMRNTIPRCVLLLVLSGAAVQAANDPNRPNFMFIISDQYRFDLIRSVQDEMPRYNGKTKIRTPNLDRLRSEGVYFSQAYTQCAVCGPSRSTFRTGNTVEHHGQQTNTLAYDRIITMDPFFQKRIEANVTFEQILVEDRGYVAEHFGKWHCPESYNYSKDGSFRVMRYNDANLDQMTYDTDYANVQFGFDTVDSSLSYKEKLAPIALECSKVEEEGMQENPYSLFPYEPDQLDNRYGMPPYSALPDGSSQLDVIGRDTLPADRSSTYVEGTCALAALERLGKGATPFCLTASFSSPHPPFVAAAKYYDYYSALQDNFLTPASLGGSDNTPWGPMSDPGFSDPEKVHEWMVSYYAMCEEVDHYVGLILDKLDELGIADNTYLVFVADHGEALGYHSRRNKGTFFEESARVPLLIRFPGKIDAGIQVDTPVTTMDLVATTLDYLNIPEMNISDGRSLRRYIEKQNDNKEFDDEAIVTEWDYREPDGSGGLTRVLGGETNFHCRKGPWKLMMTKLASSSRIDMLYNLESDPYEMDNLIGDDGMTASDEVIGKAEHLKCLLLEWMQRMDGGTNQYYSSPIQNKGEGMGDIAEIKARRQWKAMDIWVSDTAIEVGEPVEVNGQFIRNEYFYLGRTTSGSLDVSEISVQGADAGLFQLSEFTSGTIASGDYRRVKLTYTPNAYGQTINDARIVISHNAGADKVINLSNVPVANARPTVTSSAGLYANVGSSYNYTLTADDLDNGPLSFSGQTVPSWLSFDADTGVLSGTPNGSDIGDHQVVLRVSDGTDFDDDIFTIRVSAAGNDVPVVLSVPETRAVENVYFSTSIVANDADGDHLTLAAPIKPEWLGFNADTGVLSGTPLPSDIGTDLVELTVSDGPVTVTQRFNVAVFPTPIPDVNLVENGSFEDGMSSWVIGDAAVIQSGDAYDGSSAIAVTNISSSTRQLVSLTPGLTYDMSVWVNATGHISGNVVFDTQDEYDSSAQCVSNSCQYIINSVNDADGWTKYGGRFVAKDSDVNIRIFASDSNYAGTVLFDQVEVRAVGGGNNGPVITSVPVTNGSVGVFYSYTLSAADPENDALTYSEITTPSWLSLNTESGVLSGTPPAGGNDTVTVRVSDGEFSVDQSFSIYVGASPPGPVNLIQNPSFETGDGTGWTILSPTETTVSSEAASDGSFGLRYATADGGISPVRQEVTVQPNTEYTLAVDMNIPGGVTGALVARVNVGGVKHKAIVNSSTSGWDLQQLQFNSTSNTSVTLDIYCDSGFVGTAYVDNIYFSADVIGGSGYDSWAAANGISGGATDDDDLDGLDNLSEYAVGEKPSLTGSGSTLNFVYKKRTDDPSLSYVLETCTDLIAGTWTNTGVSVTGTNITGGTYNDVTNSIVTADQQSYLRLRIVNP